MVRAKLPRFIPSRYVSSAAIMIVGELDPERCYNLRAPLLVFLTSASAVSNEIRGNDGEGAKTYGEKERAPARPGMVRINATQSPAMRSGGKKYGG